ncbi:hypothetical protein [Aquimarina litoralis]|uniref:hypothetical protein n=1 Tax=Aquimarina litoralis TaxID=584605 RepID=UPI001C594B08|nr:hypothetical protein [Aquimarina litoralis]MBW1295684.1 hypothetical protein [Aquimarina litoralis]
MKKMLLFVVLVLLIQTSFSQKNLKAEPVLKEIISKFPTVRDFTISPTQDEVYFTAQGYSGELSTIIQVKKKQNKWQEPTVAAFSGQYTDLEPMFSPDGLTLFFVSNRPIDSSADQPKDQDIWYIQRKNVNSDWSKPINIGSPINTDGDEFYPSIAANGNLYFTSTGKGTKGKDDIFVSEWKNNNYAAPISLSDAINSEGYEYNAYIAPDESFLIFGGYQRKDGFGSGDLYISKKTTDNTWSKAQILSKPINSDKMDYCPYYDTNTNTLYFTSKRTIIKNDFALSKNIEQLLTLMNPYENGLSKVYSVQIKL